MTPNVRPWPGWLKEVRSRRFMEWCAGVEKTWRFGFLKSSVSRLKKPPWAVNCERRGSGKYLRAPGTRGKMNLLWKILKKLCRRVGGHPPQPSRQYRVRNMVARRGQGRPKNQADKALGSPGEPSHGTQGSTNAVGLDIRCDLPQAWRWCGARSTPLQHRGHAMASR